MPDRASTPVYDKCNSCAFEAERGSVFGPWPTLHTDVCCLYKFNRQEQSALCQDKDGGLKPNQSCDGLCKDCPSRQKFRQLQVELPVQEPVLSQTSTDAASQEGTTDVPPSCTSVHSGTRKCSKIAPRKRRGFSKLTIEIRPPRFKKKLWFGTWQEDEISRAKDAINFYMETNLPYILSDSPQIFAQHPLGIEYRQLKPSCEEFIQVGQKEVRASVYFARRVKEVIKAVTRGNKRKAQPSKKLLKSKLSAPDNTLSLQEDTQNIYEPVKSCSSGSTSSSVMPSTSPSTSSSMPCAPGDVWYGASCSEAHSELTPVQPYFVPPSEILTYEGEIPMESESELYNLCGWGDQSLDGISFLSSPSGAASGEGESGMVDYNNFPEFLWSYMGTRSDC